jgi:2-polyprenyl-6-methoxyphenol hydroxylase-like FAD-dependent oxidoreductase
MDQPKIVIVGGSLVGPAGELFLRQRGFTNVTVLESSKRPVSQSGGVMGVRRTTLSMLGEIGISSRTIMALANSDVYAYDFTTGTDPVHRGVSAFPGMVTSWDALHFELGRRVDVQLGHTVQTLEHQDDRTYLICTCGTPHAADIILWADGRKSTGRTILDPTRTLRYNGYVVWRGLVDMPPTTDIHGFDRFYDIDGGRLFSLTEPVAQSGKNYFEFSHNLPRRDWERITGKGPEVHAYMLPQQMNPTAMDLIHQHAEGLPHRFEEIIDHAEISGIPVNDVAFPEHLIHHHEGGGMSVLFGDAAVPVRLQVGAGLNNGLQQMHDFINALAAEIPQDGIWEEEALSLLARWVEQGRSRAHRNNLGWYLPVAKGRTTAPRGDQWEAPEWVTA